MIDTLEGGFLGPALDLRSPSGWAIVEDFRRAGSGRVKVACYSDEEGPQVSPSSWTTRVDGLGTVTLNVDGYVRIARSLCKTRQDLDGMPEECWNNHEVLSAEVVNKTVGDLIERAYEKFPFLDEAEHHFKPSRADVVYQRPVASSYATIKALQGATKPTAGGCAWFDNRQGVPTGIFMRGKSVAHRVYDKGLESMAPGYENILRSEEQLRSASVGMGKIWSSEDRRFQMAACREVLNDRYLDVAYGEVVDVRDLVEARSYGQALLTLHPELLPQYKNQVGQSAYYEMARKVREHRAKGVPTDLRIPEEAWR